MNIDTPIVFPAPPRQLSKKEKRQSILLILLGLVFLIGITALIPAIEAEEQLEERRKTVWNEGQRAEGTITSKTTHVYGRKDVQYSYVVGDEEYTDSRTPGHVKQFNAFKVGDLIELRVDPADPSFSVCRLDMAPSFTDGIPAGILIVLILAAGGLMTLWGFRRRRILRYGVEIPCNVQPTRSSYFLRVSYTWERKTRNRWVEGEPVKDGESVALLLDPLFPGLPMLARDEQFAKAEAGDGNASNDLKKRRAFAMVLATVLGWVTWGMLYLITGEGMPSILQTAFVFLVAFILVFMGIRPPDTPSDGSDAEREPTGDNND